MERLYKRKNTGFPKVDIYKLSKSIDDLALQSSGKVAEFHFVTLAALSYHYLSIQATY